MISQAYKILSSRQKWHFVMIVLVLILTGVSTAITLAGFAPLIGFLANGEFNLSTSPVTDIFNTMFTTSSVKSYVCFVGVFLFISTSLHLMRIWLIAQFGVSLIHDMSCTLIKNILATDYSEYSKVSNSEYAAIVLQETLEVSNKFYRPVLELIGSIFIVLIVVFTSIYLFFDKISINILIPIALLSILISFSIKVNKKQGKIKSEALALKYENTIDALDGFSEINLTKTNNYFIGRYELSSLRFSKATIIIDILAMLPQSVIQTMIYGLILIIAWHAIGQPQDVHAFEFSDGAMAALILLRLAPEITKLSANLGLINSSRRPLNRMYQNTYKHETIRKMSPVVNLADINSIQIRNLIVKPHSDAEFKLQVDKLDIQLGDRLGVIGASGSGKTTFLKIIMGLIPVPESAEVKINNEMIKNINLSNLREHLSVVSQDIFIFSASIYENIAFGLPYENIDKTRVAEICKLVDLHDVIIKNFVDGYDTTISRDHTKLSGGQRQRLAIARSLYRNSKILLLDEPSSALDEISEQKLIRALKTLPQSVTMVIVTHRMELLKLCKKVIEFKDGYGCVSTSEHQKGDQF